MVPLISRARAGEVGGLGSDRDVRIRRQKGRKRQQRTGIEIGP
jgi:hypothetical protein